MPTRMATTAAIGLFAAGAATAAPVVSHGDRSAAAQMHALIDARAAALRLCAQGAARGISSPVITAGMILTPTLDVAKAPAAPAIQLQFKTDSSGLNALFVGLESPNGQFLQLSYSLPAGVPGHTSGTITLQQPATTGGSSAEALGHYAAAGAWTVTELAIVSTDGQVSYYGSDMVATLFPTATLKVINRNAPDITPPTLSAGEIVTRTISLGSAAPVFRGRVTGADNLSGIASIDLTLTAPDHTVMEADSDISAPIGSGTADAYFVVPPGSPTGTWRITGYYTCDVAGNCAFDNSPADLSALFGGKTTFTVTP